MKNKYLCILFIALFLQGCATGYQKMSYTGGYKDTKIQDDVFKVIYAGNGYSNKATIEDYSLLRSAEVALENGYSYFIIIDNDASTSLSSYTTPVTSQTTGTYGNGSFNAQTNYYGGQTYVFEKPEIVKMIKCFKDKPTDVNGMLYDAEQIKNNLRAQYKLDVVVPKKVEVVENSVSNSNNFARTK